MSSIATLLYQDHGALAVPWGAIRATGKPPNVDPIHCGTAKWTASRGGFQLIFAKARPVDRLDMVDFKVVATKPGRRVSWIQKGSIRSIVTLKQLREATVAALLPAKMFFLAPTPSSFRSGILDLEPSRGTR